MKLFLIFTLLILSFNSNSEALHKHEGICEENREVSKNWFYFVKLADLRLSIVKTGSHESLVKIDKILPQLIGFFADLDCLEPDLAEGLFYFEEHLNITPPTSSASELKKYFDKIRVGQGT